MYDSQKRANKKWMAENYENLLIRIQKGEKAKIKAFAESQGMSLNGFVKEAIYEKMRTSEPNEPELTEAE